MTHHNPIHNVIEPDDFDFLLRSSERQECPETKCLLRCSLTAIILRGMNLVLGKRMRASLTVMTRKAHRTDKFRIRFSTPRYRQSAPSIDPCSLVATRATGMPGSCFQSGQVTMLCAPSGPDPAPFLLL